MERTLLPEVARILARWGKMVFLSGPRQVGKTTLAKQLLRQRGEGVYFNWDDLRDRKRLFRDPYFFEKEPRRSEDKRLLVFDEIHKHGRWKPYLKGVYDSFHEEHHILVTGSGRLDLFQRGGDSLLGRYVPLPLLPLSLGELLGQRPTWKQFRAAVVGAPPKAKKSRELLRALVEFGGFPEPYLKADPEFSRVWSARRGELLVREDVREATNIRQISQLEMLVHLIEPRVGGPLSLNNLREDLGVAFETVRDWVGVLERFYYLFRVGPYSKGLARALRKESKVYLYDWSAVGAPGARFENVVALHLLKAARTWSALGEASVTLHYLRDKEGREVDFLVAVDRKPMLLVECKTSETGLSPHLLYYQERLDVPVAVQLVLEEGHELEWRRGRRIQRVISADRWLTLLP